MKTENSYHYFRGREAMGRGEPRDNAARLKNALSRNSWLRGWDDERDARALAAMAARPPEVAAENAEAVQWFEAELEKWREEMGQG